MQKFNMDALTFSADPSVPKRRGGFLTPPKGACDEWTVDLRKGVYRGPIYKKSDVLRCIRSKKYLGSIIFEVGV